MENVMKRTIAILSICLLSFHLSGCALIEAVGSKVAPKQIEAQYTPPQKPMLVLVENYRDPSATQIEGEMLTRYLIDELTAHHVAPVIEFDSLAALRSDA